MRGRRLGIDVGAVRVGVALSDPDGVLATPVRTVPRDVAHGTDLAQGGGSDPSGVPAAQDALRRALAAS